MRYLIVGTIALLALLAILAWAIPTSAVEVWTPPEECADEDRVVEGNRGTHCEYVVPPIDRAEYSIVMEYPRCIEEMRFHSPGFGPLPDLPGGSLPATTRQYDGWRIYVYGEVANPTPYDGDSDGYGRGPFNGNVRLSDGLLAVRSGSWGANDPIRDRDTWPSDGEVDIWIALRIPEQNYGNRTYSNRVPHPDTSDSVNLINSCLALVRQEQADREHQAELARQATQEAERIRVTQDAVRKEQEQAEREATAQAVQATQEVRAILEDKLEIARTELIKTQTLAAELEHREVVAGIVREIIRIRLAGQEDRARLVNEHLARTELAEAEFESETAEMEARIQRYLDFNAELLTKIESYQSAVRDRLTTLRQTLAEQQARIDELEAEAQETAGAGEETP